MSTLPDVVAILTPALKVADVPVNAPVPTAPVVVRVCEPKLTEVVAPVYGT